MKTFKIKLPFKLKKPVLALGSQTKNTLCFVQGATGYISPVHPDLGILKDLLNFEKDAGAFLRNKPAIIGYDLHPDYASTKYALSLRGGYSLVPVQHHHAHICSCMAENGLKNQKVIGVAFDGTGWGSDRQIWGGEFLLCDYKNFERRGHLKEIPLIGGEKAILEPWRLTAAWFNFNKDTDNKQVLKKIYSSGINSPLASSAGRLFDAAGSMILGKRKARFEADLAIQLERLAGKNNLKQEAYKFDLVKSGEGYILDPGAIFKQIKSDLEKGLAREKIALRFHLSIAGMIVKTCTALRKGNKINKVVLSGGVFQNKILLNLSLDLLYKKGFDIYIHRYLPCNDAGISLGQAVIAGQRW